MKFVANTLQDARVLKADGYESLADVLHRAFDQASSGKGKERHAQDKPFNEQPMQMLIDLYGVGFALGQAAKKSQESMRLPHDRAVAELLGAINYLAGAVIAMERAQSTPNPANDNLPVMHGDVGFLSHKHADVNHAGQGRCLKPNCNMCNRHG